MDEIKAIRFAVEILKEMMPDDCGELMEKKFNILLKQIKDRGIEEVFREWLDEDEEVILSP
ncbi:hypothetical protein [Candidatus Acidianus copahuensis]|nr:hypothetical protein [Candidatus Acidianus copahuensis]